LEKVSLNAGHSDTHIHARAHSHAQTCHVNQQNLLKLVLSCQI